MKFKIVTGIVEERECNTLDMCNHIVSYLLKNSEYTSIVVLINGKEIKIIKGSKI